MPENISDWPSGSCRLRLQRTTMRGRSSYLNHQRRMQQVFDRILLHIQQQWPSVDDLRSVPEDQPADSGDAAMKPSAQIAYEAFYTSRYGAQLIRDTPLPKFQDQPLDVQEAWLEAAEAVIRDLRTGM